MDYINYIIFAGIVGLLVFRMLPTKGVKQITTDQLKSYLNNKNVQFIDVRTPGEYKGNHIRQFKNIPLHQLNQKLASLSKEKEVVVICQSGMRSNKASKMLKQAGFNVINVKGGMSAWS